jgi:hypothetical protein
MFFTRFNQSVPVLHRPTFVYKELIHPLLLNAIALGSLYLGPEHTAKGEALWRLAHTAVATSWTTLISHRGQYDSCNGIQVVLTALLGQIYANLSKVSSAHPALQRLSYASLRIELSGLRAMCFTLLGSTGQGIAACTKLRNSVPAICQI